MISTIKICKFLFVQDKAERLTDSRADDIKEIFQSFQNINEPNELESSNKIERLRYFYESKLLQLFKHDYMTNCDRDFNSLNNVYELTITSRAILLILKISYLIKKDVSLKILQDDTHAEFDKFAVDVKSVVNDVQSICPIFLPSYTLNNSIIDHQFKPGNINYIIRVGFSLILRDHVGKL